LKLTGKIGLPILPLHSANHLQQMASTLLVLPFPNTLNLSASGLLPKISTHKGIFTLTQVFLRRALKLLPFTALCQALSRQIFFIKFV
jgi:hypothetical protein